MSNWWKYQTQMVKPKMPKDKIAKHEAVQALPKRKIIIRSNSYESRALVKLADLTEYKKLGGEPKWDLSIMIERDDAYFLEHEAQLRELVDARSAQLRLWLDTTPATKSCKLRKEAKDCLRDISDL